MCLYIGDYEGETIETGWRRARQPHQCVECGRGIGPGERYFFAAVAMAGRVERWKMCGHCRSTIAACSALTGCPENWYWEMAIGTDEETVTGNALEHSLPPGGRVKILRLIVGYRRRWQLRGGGLMALPLIVR